MQTSWFGRAYGSNNAPEVLNNVDKRGLQGKWKNYPSWKQRAAVARFREGMKKRTPFGVRPSIVRVLERFADLTTSPTITSITRNNYAVNITVLHTI